MNAIQKAIDLLRGHGTPFYDHAGEIADELEALLKQEPAGEVRVELAAYPGCTPRFAVSWKGGFIPQFETKLYTDPRPPCDLIESMQLAADQIKKADYTPARSTLLCAIAKHTGG